jgi:hypothetical protein
MGEELAQTEGNFQEFPSDFVFPLCKYCYSIFKYVTATSIRILYSLFMFKFLLYS